VRDRSRLVFRPKRDPIFHPEPTVLLEVTLDADDGIRQEADLPRLRSPRRGASADSAPGWNQAGPNRTDRGPIRHSARVVIERYKTEAGNR
jgi:hypothetical protein